MDRVERKTRRDDATIVVWDPAVRVLHWVLVVSATTAYLTQQSDYTVHVQSGYVVLAVVCLRSVWGFIGGRYARWRELRLRPAQVARHLSGLARGTARRYLGHNPAGAAMAVCLLGSLAAATLSGIALDAAENRAGPLAFTTLYQHTDAIGAMHRITSNACVTLVLVHLLGVAVASWRQRENLLRAMITGRKPKHPGGT